jgi:hypothetical protein
MTVKERALLIPTDADIGPTRVVHCPDIMEAQENIEYHDHI